MGYDAGRSPNGMWTNVTNHPEFAAAPASRDGRYGAFVFRRSRTRSRGSAAIAEHHHAYFAGHEITERREPSGRVYDRVPGFFVHEIAPGPRYDGWTYAGVGLWEAVHEETGHGLEFVMTAAARLDRVVELLAMAAFYHAGSPDMRLGLGHTYPIGEPWLPGSRCDHMLVSLPYPFGPELEKCTWPSGHAQLLWLLPITQAERDFKAAEGLEALEQLLEDARIDPWDPHREPVV